MPTNPFSENFPFYDSLLAKAQSHAPIPTAVVAPEEAQSLRGALLAADHELITPILIGGEAKIKELAAAEGLDVSAYDIIDEPNHGQAAGKAVAMVHDGGVKAIMKGHLHTDVLLKHVVKREGGLRTSRRLSHVFSLDIPNHDRMVHITDAAMNIAPDLKTKIDIIKNAIEIAHATGIEVPNVAVLSAVETVNPDIPSTLEAASLAKMGDRGQIKGALIDGPFALDNAVSLAAAKIKHMASPVAGKADILVVPDLESGNMLVKGVTFLGGALAGGLIMGAKCPIFLSSRADDDRSRLASCALASHVIANKA